jgi:hypothetical protein
LGTTTPAWVVEVVGGGVGIVVDVVVVVVVDVVVRMPLMAAFSLGDGEELHDARTHAPATTSDPATANRRGARIHPS